jgi:hypothetical protein
MINKNIPDSIIKKFNKVLFKPGEAVCFTWLGEKCYGYVEKSKLSTWGTMYTVKMYDTKYPCGIQIDGYKTKYTTGYILFNETIESEPIELKRRANLKPEIYNPINTNKSSNERQGSKQPREVSTNTGGTRTKSTNNNRVRRKDANSINTEITSDATIGVLGAVDIRPSDSRVRGRDKNKPIVDKPKKEKTKKEVKNLDDAIKKQKDFLSGFVKKE